MKDTQLSQPDRNVSFYLLSPCLRALVLLCLLPSALFGAPADNSKGTIEISSPQRHKKIRLNDGEFFYSFSADGRAIAEGKAGGKEVPIVIELEVPSTATYAAASFTSFARQTLAAAQSRTLMEVSNRVVTLENQVRRKLGRSEVDGNQVVRRRFSELFSGLAARVQAATVPQIEQLPGVKKVWPDARVEAFADNIKTIGADRVWQELGVTGRGITVAVIDTGVDYTHADLGGGFGAGFKVIGGYDFVNSDEDPKDDMGHGTMVAGIVAANGEMRGVAPDASLLAIKVLDDEGSGYTSDVIAGMEWATSHGARVINLSLGYATASSNDPVCTAVNNAAGYGLVVVAAAGNAGPGFDSLHAPGVATGAISVGASDGDGIADFSSRGPGPDPFQVKPDLVAPGAGIRSTAPRGSCDLCSASGYFTADGSSFAAPHVAGAAALLLEKYPEYGAGKVRRALISGSTDLGHDIFEQGHGRLEVYNAAGLSLLPRNPFISLGEPNFSSPQFNSTETLIFDSVAADTVSGSFAVDTTGLPSGVSVQLDRQNFTVGAKQYTMVTINFQIDGASTPPAATYPCDYRGKVSLVLDGGKSIDVPFVFLRGAHIKMSFSPASMIEQYPYRVFVHNQKGFGRSVPVFLASNANIRVPPGRYDVFTLFFDWANLVVREDLDVAEEAQLTVSASDAINKIEIQPVYPDPLTLPQAYMLSHLLIRHKESGIGINLLGDRKDWTLSPLSPDYRFESSLFLRDFGFGLPIYLLHFGLADGVTGPTTFRNQAQDFRKVRVRSGVNEATDDVYVETGMVSRGRLRSSLQFIEPDPVPAEIQYCLMPPPYPDYSLGYLDHYALQVDEDGTAFTLFTSPLWRPFDSIRLDGYLPADFQSPAISTDLPVVPLGLGPYSFSCQFQNRADQIQLLPVAGNYLLPFLGQFKEFRDFSTLPYQLYSGDAVIRSGDLLEGYEAKGMVIDVTPGKYRLETTLPAAAGWGETKAAAIFDTSAQDPDPPYLQSFQILEKSNLTDSFPQAGAELRFSAADKGNLLTPELSFRTGDTWQPVPVRSGGSNRFEATLPGLPTNATSVGIKLILSDDRSNFLTYQTYLAKGTPDVSLDLRSAPTFRAGAIQVYELGVKNLGAIATYDDLVVTDSLPSSLELVSAAGADWNCSHKEGIVTCRRSAPLLPMERTVIRLAVRVMAGAFPEVSNSAEIQAAGDLNSVNNRDSQKSGVLGLPQEWTLADPISIGDVEWVTFDPRDAQIGYAATWSAGVFKTTDAGVSWKPVGPGIGSPSTFVVTVASDGTVYVGTAAGLFYSSDAGASWKDTEVNVRIYSVVPDPDDARRVFAAGADGVVFRTDDGGSNWQLFSTTTTKTIYSLAVGKAGGSTNVYAAPYGAGIFRSTDAGQSWSVLANGLTDKYVTWIAVDPSNPSRLMAVAWDLFKSADAGDSWTKIATDYWFDQVLISSADPNLLFGKDYSGVHKSTDEGKTWSDVGETLPVAQVNSIAFDSENPGGLWAATMYGVFRANAQGDNWQESSAGIHAIPVFDVALDWSSPGTLFSLGSSLLKSGDSGTSWENSETGLHSAEKIIVDPTNSRVMYALGDDVYRSSNGGADWSWMPGLPSAGYNCMAIDPTQPTTLYVGTDYVGVFKTTDGGLSWAYANLGLSSYAHKVLALALDPVTPSCVYAGTMDGLFKSENGAGQWARITSLPADPISTLTIPPGQSNVILVSCGTALFRTDNRGTSWTEIGKQLPDYARNVSEIVVDPQNLNILYLGTLGGGIYRSSDGGTTWTDFNTGTVGHWVYALEIDPNDPSVLYAATSEGFVSVVMRPDIEILLARKTALWPDAPAAYSITVKNSGLAKADIAEITGSLPSGSSVSAISGPNCNCAFAGSWFLCARLAGLAPGESMGTDLNVSLGPSVTSPFRTEVRSAEMLDADPSNNVAVDTSSLVDAKFSLLFPFYQGGNGGFTGFAVSNYTGDAANVLLRAYGAGGTKLPFSGNPSPQEMTPKAQLARLGNELFAVDFATVQSGWVKLLSDRPVASFFQFGNAGQLDGSNAALGTSKSLWFTRVLQGPGSFHAQPASTTLSLVNPGDAPVKVRLRLFDGISAAPISEQTRDLPARDLLYVKTSDLFGIQTAISAGYIRADVLDGDGVAGFELIQLAASAAIGLNAAASNPLGELFSAQFADVPGIFTSVKLINTSSDPRVLTLTVVDDSGHALADNLTVNLPAEGSYQAEAGAMFHWLPAGGAHVGTLKVQADGPGVVGDVVFGEPQNLVFAAALPLQTQRFREAVFSQVANGMGLWTGLAFHNPGTEKAVIAIEVYSAEGVKTGELGDVLQLGPGERIARLLDELIPATQGQIGGYIVVRSSQPLIAQQLFFNADLMSAVPPTIVE